MDETAEVRADLLPCVVQAAQNALELFTVPGRPAEVLAAIRQSVAMDADLSTGKGRRDIASMAFRVTRAKTALDDAGKGIVAEMKAQVSIVDRARKELRDGCDAIKEEVRAPLDAWEVEERARQAQVEIDAQIMATWDEAHMANELRDLKAKQLREEAERRVAEEAQIEVLRKQKAAERAEKERADREEWIRQEAEAKAKREVEEALRREKERTKKAEWDRITAEATAKERERLLAEQAKRDLVAAVEEGKARAREEQRKKEHAEHEKAEAARKKGENAKHRANVNKQVIVALVAAGIAPEAAEAVVAVVSAGKVKQMLILY